jgi:hypothetical protein
VRALAGILRSVLLLLALAYLAGALARTLVIAAETGWAVWS